jgi:hypothetical protein
MGEGISSPPSITAISYHPPSIKGKWVSCQRDGVFFIEREDVWPLFYLRWKTIPNQHLATLSLAAFHKTLRHQLQAEARIELTA